MKTVPILWDRLDDSVTPPRRSLLLYCLFVFTLIDLVVIFKRGVKRVDDSGIGGCDGVDEPGDSV